MEQPQDFSALSRVSTHTAAVTCIVVANFGFLSVAFATRPNFGIIEFYLLVCFIEIGMIAICERLVLAAVLTSLAKRQQKQLEQAQSQLREHALLLAKYKSEPTRRTEGPLE